MTPKTGTVIRGTMREEDLIPAFSEVLFTLNEKKANEIDREIPPEVWEDTGSPWRTDTEHEWWQSEAARYVLEDLFDALNDEAPEGYYFGAHEGDGADYGFHPIPDDDDII